MFNYTITTNEDKTITKQSWESHGYILSVITRAESYTSIMVESPVDAPDIHVDEFSNDKTAEVNWASIGSTSPAEAREYAAMIVTASEVAEGFQQIIDAM